MSLTTAVSEKLLLQWVNQPKSIRLLMIVMLSFILRVTIRRTFAIIVSESLNLPQLLYGSVG